MTAEHSKTDRVQSTSGQSAAGTPASPNIWAQRIALVSIWGLAITGWILFQRSTGRTTIETAQYFVDSVRGAWWALAAFVIFYAVRPLILFPATILTVMGGMLFGSALGIVATVVGANLSAMVAYGVARTLRGRHGSSRTQETPDAHAGDADQVGLMERWADKMRSESFVTVLTMRLLYLPYDLVNYSAGLLKISPWPFLAATAIGSIPGTIAFTLAGSSIERVDQGLAGFDPRVFVASVVLFVISLVGARMLRRKQPATAI